MEAEKLKIRIKKLTAQHKQSIRASEESRKTSDQRELEAKYEQEKTELSESWILKMEEYSEACKTAEEELLIKQAEAINTEEENLNASLPALAKDCSQILNLRKIQSVCIQQEEFKEAHSIQVKLDKMVDTRQGKWNEERQGKLDRALNNFRRKQTTDMASFKKKMLSGFNDLNKQKALEFEALAKRYLVARVSALQTCRLLGSTQSRSSPANDFLDAKRVDSRLEGTPCTAEADGETSGVEKVVEDLPEELVV